MYYGSPLFKKAMLQSDIVIRSDDWGKPRYIKIKGENPDCEKVEPEVFMFMKLACEELPD